MMNYKKLIGIACSVIFTLTTSFSISYGDTTLPPKYDLREENRVTKVKDQVKIDGCWAFAALSSLESNILSTKNIEMDFSENHMMNHHGFDLKAIEGGNMHMATAYLARWKGPVLKRDINKEDLHIQNVIYIPKRKSAKDNEKIKQAIKEYGALYTNLKWDDNYYNKDTKSYRSTSKLKGYDHTVTIVGWDDDYSKEKFKDSTGCKDGAFICKNSWGEDWGDDGYFYVSYDDFNIGYTDNAVFLGSEEEYDNIYQYDFLGQTQEYGFSMDTAWFSNVFQIENNSEKLSGVSFYTFGEESEYEIWVCRDFKDMNSFSKKEKIKSGSISNMGYHTISLDPLEMNENEKFAIVVKLTTKGSKKPIAIESPEGFKSSKAQANKGESFISVDGNDWLDLTDEKENSNVCLKAFTKGKEINSNNSNLSIEHIDQKDFSKGEEAYIKVKIKNEGKKPEKVALMVGLYDENNKMVNHSYMNDIIKPEEEVKLKASVLVPNEGKYTLRGFVWDDSDYGVSHKKNPIEITIK